jgi:hypothetical protein
MYMLKHTPGCYRVMADGTFHAKAHEFDSCYHNARCKVVYGHERILEKGSVIFVVAIMPSSARECYGSIHAKNGYDYLVMGEQGFVTIMHESGDCKWLENINEEKAHR